MIPGAFAVLATTREVLDHPGLGPRLLAPWELRRLDAIRVPARRDDVLAARLLLRLCAARLTGLPPEEAGPAQRCPDCARYGHGRPYLPGHPGLGLSLSHADGLVAAAAGPGAVGVDVEPAGRRPGSLRTLRRLLPEADLPEADLPGNGLPGSDLPGTGPSGTGLFGTGLSGAEPPGSGLGETGGPDDPVPALLRAWVRAEARFKAGPPAPEAVHHLTEWTDEGRAAVAAVVATTPPALLPPAAVLGGRPAGG
ncbi:4-phosphopantetheinyl transferase [Streptomyces sp. NPDC058052]|uniref:4-phosphopantetheinyl transferase n=1 Tax=Streptomyces sp. NPDC058052 TaxID=3346316 RepID=UPI0036E43E04